MPKTLVAWVLLIILLISALSLSYMKFFAFSDNTSEIPVENSANEAIDLALNEIVENFNNDDKIIEYGNQNIQINAILKNHSIFISYQTDKIITYEFKYNNLVLSVIINNDEDNLKKFEKVFIILNNAIQKRLKQEESFEDEIHEFLMDERKIEGLLKEEQSNNLKLSVSVVKKIEKGN